MFSVLSLKWKLLSGGLICALLAALSGGAGVWSLNLIYHAMEKTTGEISKNIAHQNTQVRQITRLRELISAIQNAENEQALEDLFEDLSVLHDDLASKPTKKNIYFSEAITDLLIKQQNIFVARKDIADKRTVNNESLEQIAALALNIMDDVQFDSDISISQAFDQLKEKIHSVSEPLDHAVKTIKAAHSFRYACLQMNLAMNIALSDSDPDVTDHKNDEIPRYYRNATTALADLPETENTRTISTLLHQLPELFKLTLDYRIRCLKGSPDSEMCTGSREYEKIIQKITGLSLNILDDIEFDTFIQIDGSKYFIQQSYINTDTITSKALQAIKSASLIHFNCGRIDAFMKEIFALYDVDYIRYRKQEIHTLLSNTRQEIGNLPSSDDTWEMSKLLVSFRSITDQVAKSQERVLRQEKEFAETIKQLLQEIGTVEKEVLQVGQIMKSDAEQTLINSTNLINKWQNIEFLLMAIAVILATLIGITLSQSVLRQLKALNKGIKIVGKGDLSFKVDTGTRDEIGILSRAFDDMASNIQKTQADLGRALEEAKEANQAKSEFLANMSHELRTPLNAILGFTQIMERNQDLSATHKEELGIISRSGEHLLGLINDVLNIAKIESGQSSLNNEVFDLPRLLQGIEEMFSVRAKSQNIQFLMEIGPGTPSYIEADPGKIRQILINIIGNAIKFTKKGFVSLKLKCHQQQEQLDLQFEVEDSGSGIPPEKLATIFDPFVQAGSSKELTAGTGLGLAISRKFIMLMGGEISVRSEVGHGSSFQFNIPATTDSGMDVEPMHASKRIIGLAPDQPNYRILIVEDRLENRMLLRKLLQIIGFEVLEAVDGKEGVKMFETEHPDFIWMDIKMPVMDGYEATRMIKESEAGRKTPVIALTASALEEQRQQIFDAGCDDLVSKPFKEEEIFSTLQQYLGMKYIYEDIEDTELHIAQGKSVETVINSKEGLSLPVEIMIELSEAALELDGEKCLSIIEQIRSIDGNTADILSQFVNNYQFEELHHLVDDAIKKQE